MTSYAVYVATTEGPVQIQRITGPVTLFLPEENAADIATPPPTNVVLIAHVREVLEFVIPAGERNPRRSAPLRRR